MSVGRLGVIVSVTVRVEENSRTERHVKVMSAEELIEELDEPKRSSRRTTLL